MWTRRDKIPEAEMIEIYGICFKAKYRCEHVEIFTEEKAKKIKICFKDFESKLLGPFLSPVF